MSCICIMYVAFIRKSPSFSSTHPILQNCLSFKMRMIKYTQVAHNAAVLAANKPSGDSSVASSLSPKKWKRMGGLPIIITPGRRGPLGGLLGLFDGDFIDETDMENNGQFVAEEIAIVAWFGTNLNDPKVPKALCSQFCGTHGRAGMKKKLLLLGDVEKYQ